MRDDSPRLCSSGFALLAVTLAGVGIYGVMSLYVANRKPEFGIRLAVGAEPAQLVRLVLGEGALLAASGVGVGVVGALDRHAMDPVAALRGEPDRSARVRGLPFLLVAIAVASCYVPARRAAKSDPLSALRAE